MSNLRLDIDSFWVSLVSMRQHLMEAETLNQEYVCLVWDKNLTQWIFYSEHLVSIETHCILIPLLNQRSLFLDRLCDTSYTVANPFFSESGQSFWLTNHTLDDLSSLQLYLTFILEEFKARKEGRCFVMEHRSLEADANQTEVLHFHRLRSLFDGIVVNWQDAKQGKDFGIDFVAGESPVKVVLDPQGDLAADIQDLALFNEGAPAYVIVSSKQAQEKLGNALPLGSDVFLLEEGDKALPAFLAEKGVNSLLYEGTNNIN